MRFGLGRAVPSTILEPATYGGLFGAQTVGFYSNCEIHDVREALRDVYENYAFWEKHRRMRMGQAISLAKSKKQIFKSGST